MDIINILWKDKRIMNYISNNKKSDVSPIKVLQLANEETKKALFEHLKNIDNDKK